MTKTYTIEVTADDLQEWDDADGEGCCRIKGKIDDLVYKTREERQLTERQRKLDLPWTAVQVPGICWSVATNMGETYERSEAQARLMATADEWRQAAMAFHDASFAPLRAEDMRKARELYSRAVRKEAGIDE